MDLFDKYHHIIWHHDHPSDIGGSKDDMELNLGLVFRLLFFLAMFFALFIVIGLCGFHCYLSTTNQTTYEMVKPHILEKWVKEESKRKRRHHPNDRGYAAVDVNDDTENEMSDVDGKYKRENNNMISFDEGLCKNLWAFWSGKLKKVWITPYTCRLQGNHDDL